MSLESADDLLKEANELMVEEEFQSALEKYNAAIDLDDSLSSAFLHRSASHLKLKNFQSALDDATRSIELKPKNSTAHYRSGISNFHLENFKAAKVSLVKAKELGNKKCDLWIRKCDAEIADSDDPAPEVHPQKIPKVVDRVLPPSPSNEEDVKMEDAELISNGADNVVDPNAKPKPIRTSFIQLGQFAKFTIFSKGLKRDDVSVEFTSDSLSVKVTLAAGGMFYHDVKLWSEIDPSQSSFLVNPYKVVISLKKLNERQDWETLESPEQPDSTIQRRANLASDGGAMTSYPSSGKKTIDWDAVDKEAREEQENEKLEGDSALNKLFSDIYGKADEDTRRAMIKSMQTSNGTCLSTNWKEVRNQNYEDDLQAPKGSEIHKYEY
uniref:Protein SGT1 homolog isoform X1 n=1 Tax=Hirondellea gigas TaxID=1518452 RepID=A0A6A7FY03_9CRUS